MRRIKNDVVKVGFEKSAKSAGKEVFEGIGALMGNPKAKKLQSEVDSLKQDIEILQGKKENIEKQTQKAITEKDSLIATQKGKLDKLFDSIPILKDYDFIIRLCQTVKIPFEIVKHIFSGKEASYSGKLYSPEQKQDFEADNAKISIA